MSDAGRVPLYDNFSGDYDAMVDWPTRLEREWPFFEAAFERAMPGTGQQRVLDVGCGTGHHALHFASRGRVVVGVDPSAPMVQRSVELARARGLDVSFVRAGFGELRAKVTGQFDAVTCLGNTLPHALSRPTLLQALQDMAAVLRPGGVVVIQQLNYDRICANRQRFLGLSSSQANDEEVLFFRFYDFDDPLLNFNVVRMRRAKDGGWTYAVDATRLQPIVFEDLAELLPLAGFERPEYYGGYDRAPFDPASSNDLVVLAFRRQ